VRPTGARIIDHVVGGYPPGLPLVIAGVSGSGRTVLSLELANRALERGEIVQFVSSEPAPSLIHQAGELGFAFGSALRSDRLVLLELDAAVPSLVRAHGIEALAESLLAQAPDAGVVIVDPFTALTAEIVDEPRLREVARVFARALPARHLVLTVEAERLATQRGLDRVLSELCGAYLVVAREPSGRRTLTVEKTRSGAGAAECVEFAVGPGGTHLVGDAVPKAAVTPHAEPAPRARRHEPDDAPLLVTSPLPAAAPPPPAPPVADELLGEPKERRPCVLVVEDSRLQRELVSEWLGERYEVLTAADGFEAMATLLAHKPDLVILDLIMPRVTGYELLCALRRASLDVPVLVSSSRVTSAGDRLGPLVLGATDFLAKPVNRLELEHKVETLLRLRRVGDRRFDAGEAEALFGKVTSSRLLEEPEFRDRLGRAHGFGERHGLPSSIGVVVAPDAGALERWIDLANSELRFEDAILRLDKQRAVVLLVATAPAEAHAVLERLASEDAGGERKVDVEILPATPEQLDDALARGSGPV
jgi:CheY-like chemotaxis protein/archaellum biogenesis ATPase FlaH